MKTLLFIFVSFITFQNISISEARKNYKNASNSKQNALNYYDAIKDYSGNNQTILAYKGAAFALQSKFTGTKESKKQNFTKGVNFIENAVKSEPSAVEIRMIRLSVQENIPKFMKYKMNMEDDKKMILKAYASQSNEIKKIINDYVKTSKFFTENEKNKLK